MSNSTDGPVLHDIELYRFEPLIHHGMSLRK